MREEGDLIDEALKRGVREALRRHAERSIAGTRRVVAYFTRIARGQDVRLRRPNEPPAAPDAYTPVWKAAFVVTPDTQYAPVRSLLAFR